MSVMNKGYHTCLLHVQPHADVNLYDYPSAQPYADVSCAMQTTPVIWRKTRNVLQHDAPRPFYSETAFVYCFCPLHASLERCLAIETGLYFRTMPHLLSHVATSCFG